MASTLLASAINTPITASVRPVPFMIISLTARARRSLTTLR
jgi:hypothetical protein